MWIFYNRIRYNGSEIFESLAGRTIGVEGGWLGVGEGRVGNNISKHKVLTLAVLQNLLRKLARWSIKVWHVFPGLRKSN